MADEQKQTTEELNDSQVGLLAADAEETKDETPDLREKTLNSQGEEEVELQEKPSTPAEGEKEGEEKKENENESDESKKEEPKDKTKQQLKEEEKAKKTAEKKAKEEEKKQKKEEEKKKEALKKEEEKKQKEEEKKAKEEAKKAAKEAKLEKKAAAATEATPEGEAEEGAEAVTKQPRKFQKPAILTVQRDDDRDTRHVNDVVKITFEDVIAEPMDTHSFDITWKIGRAVFAGTRKWLYRLLACLVAVPCAIFWGCMFAWLQCSHIWCYMPCIKFTTVKLNFIGQMWKLLLGTCLNPVFDSMGRCFGGINVHRTQDPHLIEKTEAQIA